MGPFTFPTPMATLKLSICLIYIPSLAVKYPSGKNGIDTPEIKGKWEQEKFSASQTREMC